jgi:arylsulfatase A-like enzyme
VSVATLSRLAIALGLCFGFLEALETAALRHVPGINPLTKVSLDVLWVAPAVHVAINLVAATGLAVLARAGLPMPIWFAAGALALIDAAAVAAYSATLWHASSLLLALGVAVQVARISERPGAQRFLRIAALAVAALVLAAPVGLQVERQLAASRVSQRPPADPSRPNILVLVLDTVRADYLSAYGYPRETTPRIDRFAREGALFAKAYSSSSWTLPSHASILTGLTLSQHGASTVGHVFTADHPRLPRILQEHGYATGAFVANNIVVLPERGFADGFDEFDAHYLRSLVARTTFGRSAKAALRRVNFDLDAFRSAASINARFEQWRGSIGERPYFALINYMEAHQPYSAGKETGDLRIWDRGPSRTADENHVLADLYERAVTGLDAEIGRLLDDLARQPRWNETLVVVLSDHGEAIADGSFDHGTDLTIDQIHIPMIFRLPGRVPAGLTIGAPVSVTDVAATILDLAGVPGRVNLPGHSLSDWWKTDSIRPNTAGILSELVELNEQRQMRSIVSGDYQYIVDESTGEERLYDLLRDPSEERNLASDAGSASVMQHLREALRSIPPPSAR